MNTNMGQLTPESKVVLQQADFKRWFRLPIEDAPWNVKQLLSLRLVRSWVTADGTILYQLTDAGQIAQRSLR